MTVLVLGKRDTAINAPRASGQACTDLMLIAAWTKHPYEIKRSTRGRRSEAGKMQ